MILDSDNIAANILLAHLANYPTTSNPSLYAAAKIVTAYVHDDLHIDGFVMGRGLKRPDDSDYSTLNTMTSAALAQLLTLVITEENSPDGATDLHALLEQRGTKNPWNPTIAITCSLGVTRIAGGFPSGDGGDGVLLDAVYVKTPKSTVKYLLTVTTPTTGGNDETLKAGIARFEGDVEKLLTGQWAQCVDDTTRQA